MMEIYSLGNYDVFLEERIGIGGYSVVYVGKCNNADITPNPSSTK